MEVRGQRKEEETESINYVGRADGVEYIAGIFFKFLLLLNLYHQSNTDYKHTYVGSTK
jgi:hypothetical protein